ncbi:hypothetical protein [Enterovibrio nigricans]|uniref:Uncharacterized protein n=1 Tax=Enterovibrio nigricans DSM 22720 TaxID=1121868 RepID=A0A1T4VPE1_9GAMM|nr:hypothetical protein [Enterovibrio nigricans]PKF49620.1 hypothetical protein AT251_17660 [Enterovibrio nigricans]SKA66391.1 hypothetical protein SAMN02745132_04108 [Enterovibrio nigricans DSM 22720]
MIADHFVWLAGGRVLSRRQQGKNEIVTSDSPLLLTDELKEGKEPTQIKTSINGIEKVMNAFRVNARELVVWESH